MAISTLLLASDPNLSTLPLYRTKSLKSPSYAHTHAHTPQSLSLSSPPVPSFKNTSKMVSKCAKKTPIKSIKDRRRRHRKSPGKSVAEASSAIITSINKTIYTCKRRLAKLFSKLARIGTPNSRYKGYKVLKKRLKFPSRETPQELQLQNDSICRVLAFNDLLPPLVSLEKRTVFLDLDETLVHSTTDPPSYRFDFFVRAKIGEEYMNFYVVKRPGVDAFLEALGAKFEVVVFTAGLKEYASLVLDRLDVKGVISHRLYRDSCTVIDGKFVKDLSQTGRDLQRAVIVDDNPNCYVFQPENAVPVRPFIDDLGDAELVKLGRFFEQCDCFDDMRDAVKQFVNDGKSVLQPDV